VACRPSIWAITLAAGGATADSVLAALSRPFTLRADLATGVGLATVVLIGLVNFRLHDRQEVVVTHVPATRPGRPVTLAWGALASAVVIFELVSYFATPRETHPTISSLLDVLAGHEVLRGLLFATWLGAGWWLWRTS